MASLKKLSRHFIVGIKDFRVTPELLSFLKEFPVGGLALFNSPFDSPDNIWNDRETALEIVYDFIKQIKPRVQFLAADQEGGRVRRLRSAFIPLPSAQALVESFGSDFESLKDLFRLSAEQMALSQIHLNFAPVADLVTSESNQVIGDRSFGSTSPSVLPYIKIFCESFENANVHTTLKHFPGHGPTRFDSHQQIAILFKKKKELMREDMKIFVDAQKYASAIMTAHIAFEEEPERIFSLDKDLIQEFRAHLDPSKALITDDLLNMKAVSDRRPWVQAYFAGYDFILICGSLDQSAQAMEDCIRELEGGSLDFRVKQEIDQRIKRAETFFRSDFNLPALRPWISAIEEKESQALEILGRKSRG